MIADKVHRTVDLKTSEPITIPISMDVTFPIDAILDDDIETRVMIWNAKYSYAGTSNWGF